MTREEMLSQIWLWAQAHDILEKQWDAMELAFGASLAELPLFNASWAVFEEYTRTLSELIDDREKRLEWYCSEDDSAGAYITLRQINEYSNVGEVQLSMQELEEVSRAARELMKNYPDEVEHV
jgi:hypothetical protein